MEEERARQGGGNSSGGAEPMAVEKPADGDDDMLAKALVIFSYFEA